MNVFEWQFSKVNKTSDLYVTIIITLLCLKLAFIIEVT